MTAKEICGRARLHKTKVSRAVVALETKRYLTRSEVAEDRRHELLELTPAGVRVFDDLYEVAAQFDKKLMASFTKQEQAVLRKCLTKIAEL